jgi:hypothetical protein
MDLSTYNRTESLVVDAPADVIYELIADVGRMGEWSPVCTGGEYDTDAEWFTGHNAIGTHTWSTRCRVIAADPGREFTFINCGRDGGLELVRWGFELRPTTPNSTEVVQSWQVLPAYAQGFEAEGPDSGELSDRLDFMKAMAEQGMPETLQGIKRAAEGFEAAT